MRKWTIGNKMFFTGVLLIAALAILAGNMYYLNLTIKRGAEQVALRNRQMELLNAMRRSQSDLMLGTMDMIIDKDQERANEEQMKRIDAAVSLFEKNLNTFQDLTDTQENKILTEQVQKLFSQQAKNIQSDLVHLIRESLIKVKEIDHSFIQIKDELRRNDEEIKNNFEQIFVSAQKKQKEASDMSLIRNQQVILLNKLMQSYFNLILAAKDAIIDKSEGEINEARGILIDKNIGFIENNLDNLVGLADSDMKKKATEKIHDAFPQLAKLIRTDLKDLIERYASHEYFIELQYELVSYDLQIADDFEKIVSAVQKEQKEASDMMLMRNHQMMLLNDLMRSYSDLMLGAVYSITNKEKGEVSKKEIRQIEENISFISDNLESLTNLADTDEEWNSANLIRDIFPDVARKIQTELFQMIREGGVTTHEIKRNVTHTVDLLIQYDAQISDEMLNIFILLQHKQKQASESFSKLIAASFKVGMTVFFITLLVTLPVFFLISRSVTKPLSQIIKQLTESADHIADASAHLASASQSLAESSSEQVVILEETSVSLENLTTESRETFQITMGVEQLMNENIKKSALSLKEMVELMSKMTQIETSSDHISQVIQTIDNISFQTNLLALNAAIEAARAGEAGAGFAVVADEVRNLSLRTTQAAKNTQELLNGITERVIQAAGSIKFINSDFEGIIESATVMGERTAQITRSSKKNAEEIGQINQAILKIDEMTQQNAADAEEFATSSEETDAQAEQLRNFVYDLETLVKVSRSKDSRNPWKEKFGSFQSRILSFFRGLFRREN